MKSCNYQSFHSNNFKIIFAFSTYTILLICSYFFLNIDSIIILIQRPVENNKLKPIPKPFALIDIHGSGATFPKNAPNLERLKRHPLVKNKVFLIRLCVSNKMPLNIYSSFPVLRLNCDDKIWPETGFNCRVQNALIDYVMNYPTIPWNFKMCDDTLLNLDNLYTILYNLYQIYDPFTELVFKAHAHIEKTVLVFPHGGSGWIWSYAWCKFQSDPYYDLQRLYWKSRYRQDDTSQQIILRHVFNDSRYWDEYNFVGFRMEPETNIEEMEHSHWNKLPECNLSLRYGRVNEIISLHTFSNYWNTTALQKAMFSAPDQVYYHRINKNGYVHICYSESKDIDVSSTSVESLKKNYIQLKEKDMPKYIFDYSELPDDNSNERHEI